MADESVEAVLSMLELVTKLGLDEVRTRLRAKPLQAAGEAPRDAAAGPEAIQPGVPDDWPPIPSIDEVLTMLELVTKLGIDEARKRLKLLRPNQGGQPSLLAAAEQRRGDWNGPIPNPVA
ncbi:MAG: hypothetical protein ACREHD_19760 [Pirellulales bacterium]